MPYALLLGIVTGLSTIVLYLSLAGRPIALLVKYVDAAVTTPAWTDVSHLAQRRLSVLVAVLEGWVHSVWNSKPSHGHECLTTPAGRAGRRGRRRGIGIDLGDSSDGVLEKIVLEEFWESTCRARLSR